MATKITLEFDYRTTKQQVSEALIIAGTDISLDSFDMSSDRDVRLRDDVGMDVGTMYVRTM